MCNNMSAENQSEDGFRQTFREMTMVATTTLVFLTLPPFCLFDCWFGGLSNLSGGRIWMRKSDSLFIHILSVA
jgi:hypothetical protein